MIALYYIKPSKDGSLVEEIQVDEKYGIVNWPKEFFDQTANEQEKIIKASLKKRLKK